MYLRTDTNDLHIFKHFNFIYVIKQVGMKIHFIIKVITNLKLLCHI